MVQATASSKQENVLIAIQRTNFGLYAKVGTFQYVLENTQTRNGNEIAPHVMWTGLSKISLQLVEDSEKIEVSNLSFESRSVNQ
jgi:hypothetical protein